MNDAIVQFITAASLLGAAAFGFVEALKTHGWFGSAGTGRVRQVLGKLAGVLESVYGENSDAPDPNALSGFELVLRGAFTCGPDALRQVLRNGLRLALTGGPGQAQLLTTLGQDKTKIDAALEVVRAGSKEVAGVLDEGHEKALVVAREAIGRVELLIDARVDAAVAAGDRAWAGWMRTQAMIVAMIVGAIVGGVDAAVGPPTPSNAWTAGAYGMFYGLLVGLAAVPIAPLSKELLSLVSAARGALAGRPR